MKKYFSLLSFILAIGLVADAQVCLKPVPMTAQQVQLVSGKWKGTYTNSSGQQEIEINIYVKTGNDVICEVTNPPLTGKETDVEYFFCPGGEFHMRKFVGDISYVFQAVPENGQMKGMISIYDKNLKRSKAGDFVLTRQL